MPTPPVASVHRTAWFAIHHPTRHVQAVLERAFRDYTDAYTELLFVAARFDLGALRSMATYALDARTGAPRMNARTLSQRLFLRPDLPPQVSSVLSRLPSRLRQSVKAQVGQTLMSYVVLADAALRSHHGNIASHGKQAQAPLPSFPSRLRRRDTEAERQHALLELSQLADHHGRERELAAILQRTRLPTMIPVPFVGVSHDYGCGLYYQDENRTFYARLDVVAPSSHAARPIHLRGCYRDIKTGIRYKAEEHRTPDDIAAGIASFGGRSGSLLVPLELDRAFHEQTLRFTQAAFLPQRGTDKRHPAPSEPVHAKLTRKVVRGKVSYALHVTFAMPLRAEAQERAALPYQERVRLDAKRPLLAINRGLYHLYSAVVTSCDGRQILAELAADGRELLRAQQAIENIRRVHQERGVSVMPGRDRRAGQVAAQHVAIAANQIARMAAQFGAQVVLEDLQSFTHTAKHQTHQAVPPAQGKNRRTRALHTMLNRRQFEALHQAIDSRLDMLGLPRCQLVGAAYISQTCPRCGARDPHNAQNRANPRTFLCVCCSYQADIDQVAAHNVARKLVWLRLRSAEKGASIPERERTPWEAFARDFAREVRSQESSRGGAHRDNNDDTAIAVESS